MSRIKDAWNVLTGKKRLKTIYISGESFSPSDGEAVIAVDNLCEVDVGDELKVGDIGGLLVKHKALIVVQKGVIK